MKSELEKEKEEKMRKKLETLQQYKKIKEENELEKQKHMEKLYK